MKTEQIRAYQTEVVPVNGKGTSEFYTAMDTIAKQFGAQAFGNYDWEGKGNEPNAFSMFQDEEQANAFKKAVLDSGLIDIVTARVKPIEL